MMPPLHWRLVAAWSALRGRPTVAFTPLVDIEIKPGTLNCTIVGNHVYDPRRGDAAS